MKFRLHRQPARNFIPRRLALLLVAFVALAVFYSLIIPLFEGPDEDDHFRFATYLADYHALPVQLFEPGGGAAGHQGWQPPLYYSLVAAVISPLDTSDFPQHLWRNPAATFVGDPACCGRNIYFHTDSENFPFTRTTLAVHLARLLTILLGAVTVWATYKLAELAAETLWEPPLARSLALGAAAVVAFNPSFLFLSALVSNDVPLAAFSALVLLVWGRSLLGASAPSYRTAAVLGVLIGLAVLTKTTAIGLIPLSVLLLLFLAWRRRDLRFAVVGNAILLVVTAVLSGWWFLRNQILYGDPLASRLVAASALFPRTGPLTLSELLHISLPWIWQTFWGGPTPGDFSFPLLVVLALVAGVALVGTLFLVRKMRFEIRTLSAFLAAWLGFILIAQLEFIRTTQGADQGRYLFPAIPAFALFFVLGLAQLASLASHYLSRLLPRLSRITNPVSRFIPLSFVICSFAIGVFVPFAYTLPAYAHPALLSADDLKRISHPLRVDFADRLQLEGYDLPTRFVRPGDSLRVTVYWRALAPMSESYRLFVHLVGLNDRSAGGVDVIPARGAFPTVYWKPGDALRETVDIPVTENALPGKYSIEVGWYPVGSPGDRLVVDGRSDDRILLDAVKVAPRQALAYTPQTRTDATFGQSVKLNGYDAEIRSGSVTLTLYWQSLSPLDRDYTVFVHLLDGEGKRVAQADQQPQGGNNPTSLWQVGEQIRDEYILPLPADTSGPYRVEMGMYLLDTGARLPLTSGGKPGDHFEFTMPGALP